MESNTKFGLALIVLLVGTLAVVVYKKMDRRHADDAAAAKANSDPDSTAGTEGPSRFDRARSDGSARPGASGEGETDGDGISRSLPVQSEPPLNEEPEPRSTAYRGPAGTDVAPSTAGGDDGYSGHPLRQFDAATGAAVAEPNPFPPATIQSSSSAPRSTGATTNPFANATADIDRNAADLAQSAADTQSGIGAADDGSASLTDAVGAGQASSEATTGSSPFDPATGGTARTAATDSDDNDVVEAPWSPVGQSQIEAVASTAVSSDPGTTTAVPVSHDAPWEPSGAASARHAVGSASESPPFSPVQAQYDSRPQSTAPAPEAAPAEASPWDAVRPQTDTSSNASGATSDPFATIARQSAAADPRTAEQQQLDSDLSTFGAVQSSASADDRPEVYIVRSGDTYWDISRQQYGTGRYYRALALYNSHRIPDPRRMRKGMKVLIPAREILDSRFASVLPQRNATAARLPSGLFHQDGEVRYRVGRGDTLGAIAQRHLGRATRWPEILRLNQSRLANPATLKIGTELRLPADASRVRVVSEASERR